MLYLKEANTEDVEKEYEFITNTPENENGFINENHGSSRIYKLLPRNKSKG